MHHKTLVNSFVYFLAVLMLVVNTAGVAASPVQAGQIFTVSPTGVDDTANIQQAFDLAVAAGKGSTVQLTAGNFRTGFIEVMDFDGYFKGAGQGVTVIDTFADQDCQARVDKDQWPSVFQFTRGYPRVSNLSFHITPANPCQPYSMDYFGPDWRNSSIIVLLITSLPWNPQTDCPVIQKDMVSASVTQVTIEGEAGVPLNGETDPFFSNVLGGIEFGGTLTTHVWEGTDCIYQERYGQGEFKLTNNILRKVNIGLNPIAVFNSQVIMKNNSIDTASIGFINGDNSGSVLEISHNRFENIWGNAILSLQTGPPSKPFIQTASAFNIHHNDISVFGNANGVVVWDFDNLGSSYYPSTGKRALVNIYNNNFTLDPSNVWGIWLEGVDDAIILKNKFNGSSAPAIYAGSWGPSRRGLISGNDFRQYSLADGSPYKIVLEAGTENYIVTGVPVEAVADYGTNNLIGGKKSHAMGWFKRIIQDELGQKVNWNKRFHLPER